MSDIALHWGRCILNQVSQSHEVRLVHVREDLGLAHVPLKTEVSGGEALAVDKEGPDAQGVFAIEGLNEDSSLGLIRSVKDYPVVPRILKLALGREIGDRIHGTQQSEDRLVLEALSPLVTVYQTYIRNV